MKIRKAVIVAAGWGTRFLPITKSIPKEMLPLVDRPLIQYAVEEAVACGAEMVVLVTAKGKDALEDHFDRSLELETVLEQKGKTELLERIRRLSNIVDICCVRQKERLGLGHAVLTAKPVVGDEPFMVILPDDLFQRREQVLKGMLKVYEIYQRSVLAVLRVSSDQISRYGVIKTGAQADGIWEVEGMVEKPEPAQAPSDLAIMGRYVLPPEVFIELENTPPGRGNEIQLTDALQQLVKSRGAYAYEIQGEYYDAGTTLGWIKATIAMASRHPEMGPAVREYIGRFQNSE